MSNYYNVKLEEIQDLLKAEKGWRTEKNNPSIKEVVFCYQLKNHPEITIKVYSGITLESGASRTVGQDAFRICAVNTKLNRGWIKSLRCYRVIGWRANLQTKIMQVIAESKARLSVH